MQSQHVKDILSAYFTILGTFLKPHAGPVVSLISKFVDFLCYYVLEAPETSIVVANKTLLLYAQSSPPPRDHVITAITTKRLML